MREALVASNVRGTQLRALAIDATGSSVLMLGGDLKPISEYYLWCDHRAWKEAAEITKVAHATQLEAINWCGGKYSSEWGWSKLLHWLRHNPDQRSSFVSAVENCDMVTATLCGITSISDLKRSLCAMGHKWMWNERWGGLPPEEFWIEVDPLFRGIREKMGGKYLTSESLAGNLCQEWADRLGLPEGIPLPVGALDAHWDSIGANIRLGDVVNVIGTSTCVIAMTHSDDLIPGVAGIVPGSVSPFATGIEAGLSAVGDMFEGIASRSNSSLQDLSEGLEAYKAGQTGLLRMAWDNGDRTILGNPELGGMTLGWNLIHTAQDELFAAIEGTAFHTKMILERMEEFGTPVNRVINGGGIPQRNTALNQIYANVINKPVLVPQQSTISLGPAIFAFCIAGEFPSLEAAQDQLCIPFQTYLPQADQVETYAELFQLFKNLYFAFGVKDSSPAKFGETLPRLRAIAHEIREKLAIH
jgi:L-ribulokinase